MRSSLLLNDSMTALEHGFPLFASNIKEIMGLYTREMSVAALLIFVADPGQRSLIQSGYC